MPENTADFDIPKPLDTDSPPSIETAVGPGFDRVDELFGAVDLSQLVVPGGSDGKLLIVKDGAAAYKAMSGDATIDEDGVLQLGKGVVGTEELGDKSVTGAKIDEGTIPDSKLAKPVIRGYVNEAGEGSGSGFTVEHEGTGKYVIVLTKELGTAVIPVATIWPTVSPTQAHLQIFGVSTSKTQFKVHTFSEGITRADIPFSFMVLPR